MFIVQVFEITSNTFHAIHLPYSHLLLYSDSLYCKQYGLKFWEHSDQGS